MKLKNFKHPSILLNHWSVEILNLDFPTTPAWQGYYMHYQQERDLDSKGFTIYKMTHFTTAMSHFVFTTFDISTFFAGKKKQILLNLHHLNTQHRVKRMPHVFNTYLKWFTRLKRFTGFNVQQKTEELSVPFPPLWVWLIWRSISRYFSWSSEMLTSLHGKPLGNSQPACK